MMYLCTSLSLPFHFYLLLSLAFFLATCLVCWRPYVWLCLRLWCELPLSVAFVISSPTGVFVIAMYICLAVCEHKELIRL